MLYAGGICSTITHEPDRSTNLPLPFFLLEGNLVVWQHEHSVWPIINAIVASAEQTLSREQVDQMSAFVTGIASSECSASMAALPDLPVAMNRIVTCLDFVDACLVVSSCS